MKSNNASVTRRFVTISTVKYSFFPNDKPLTTSEEERRNHPALRYVSHLSGHVTKNGTSLVCLTTFKGQMKEKK